MLTVEERSRILSAIFTQEALENSLMTFHASTDKELATMAAYKSLGLDPRDVPRFGWGQMMGRPPEMSVTQQINATPQAAVPVAQQAPAAKSPWKAALLGGLAVALLGGIPAAALVWGLVRTASPTAQPAATEFDLTWRIKDGKLEYETCPVEPGK